MWLHLVGEGRVVRTEQGWSREHGMGKEESALFPPLLRDPTWLQASGFLSIEWEVGYVRGFFLIQS